MGVVPEAQTGQYPVAISDGLAEFLGTGEREILQSEALRRVWDYIEANHLEVSMPFVCTILIRSKPLKEVFHFSNSCKLQDNKQLDLDYRFQFTFVTISTGLLSGLHPECRYLYFKMCFLCFHTVF